MLILELGLVTVESGILTQNVYHKVFMDFLSPTMQVLE